MQQMTATPGAPPDMKKAYRDEWEALEVILPYLYCAFTVPLLYLYCAFTVPLPYLYRTFTVPLLYLYYWTVYQNCCQIVASCVLFTSNKPKHKDIFCNAPARQVRNHRWTLENITDIILYKTNSVDSSYQISHKSR